MGMVMVLSFEYFITNILHFVPLSTALEVYVFSNFVNRRLYSIIELIFCIMSATKCLAVNKNHILPQLTHRLLGKIINMHI